MPLSVDLAAHRDRILAELDAVHDYYTNAKAAWRFVQDQIAEGRTFSVHNPAAGNTTGGVVLATKANEYVTGYLAVATFQQIVSLFEDFVFGVMRHWLLAYPQQLRHKQVPFAAVLDAPELVSGRSRHARRASRIPFPQPFSREVAEMSLNGRGRPVELHPLTQPVV